MPILISKILFDVGEVPKIRIHFTYFITFSILINMKEIRFSSIFVVSPVIEGYKSFTITIPFNQIKISVYLYFSVSWLSIKDNNFVAINSLSKSI